MMDLHNHTTWSDGLHSVRDLAENAARHNVKHLGVTDHLHTLKVKSLPYDKVFEYVQEIRLVQNEFRHSLKLYAGVEINLNTVQTKLSRLDYGAINQLDYVLLEGVEESSEFLKLTQLPKYLKNIECAAGFAHADLLNIAQDYQKQGGLDFVLKFMKEHNLFWEINTSQRYPFFNLLLYHPDFFLNEEIEFLLDKLKQYQVPISVGSDTHSFEYYEIERLRKGNEVIGLHRLLSLF